jgi:CheY-like chemotaxis protein
MSLSTPGVERVRVLIVDHDEDQRHLLRLHFESAGCDVTVAASAEAAILAWDDAEPDLAVIELLLPGMNGWALRERLGVDYPACPVAICSVLDQQDYPPNEAALPKPVSRESVLAVLGRCVPQWSSP